MPLNVKDYPDLPALIRALAAAYHEGAIYPMAKRIGVASGTVQQWENGLIKVPTIATLRLLSDAYGLDLGDLINLAAKRPTPRKLARAIRGGSDAAPIPSIVQVLEKIVSYRTLGAWLAWCLPSPWVTA